MNPPIKVPLVASILISLLYPAFILFSIIFLNGGIVQEETFLLLTIILLPTITLAATISFTILSRRLFQNKRGISMFFGVITTIILFLPLYIFIDVCTSLLFPDLMYLSSRMIIGISIIIALVLTLPALKGNRNK